MCLEVRPFCGSLKQNASMILVVREGASAMAMLCKQVPPASNTVFPTSTSPAALRASTGEAAQAAHVPNEAERPDVRPDRPVSDPRPDRPESEPRPDVKPPPVPVVSISVAPDVAAR